MCLFILNLFAALLIRLSSRKFFPVALDEQSQTFIWNIICQNEIIEIFVLKEPRPVLVQYNRYENLDPELEIICEPVR